jgi:UDPglucose 6-dehydrogenase
MLEKIREALGGEVRGKTVALLGLTFKPNTDDLRESPAMGVLDGLLGAGALVRAYDPAAVAAHVTEGRQNVILGADEYEAAQGADALVLATEWNQFRSLDIDRLREALNSPVIVDLRNVYDPETMVSKGFQYSCVGR